MRVPFCCAHHLCFGIVESHAICFDWPVLLDIVCFHVFCIKMNINCWLVVWNIFYFSIYWEQYFSEGFKPPTRYDIQQYLNIDMRVTVNIPNIFGICTIWLFNSLPWYRWAYRNRWFNVLKNGGSFHGKLLVITRGYVFSLGARNIIRIRLRC